MASKFKNSGVSKEDILSTLDNFQSSGAGLENKENNGLHPNRGSGYTPDTDCENGSWDFLETHGISSPPPASLSHSYSLEWDVLFSKPERMMQKLKDKATAGDLRSSRFRSVIWKLFLEVIPPQLDKWVEKSRESRAKFEELKNRLIVNPRKAVDAVNLKLHNPLSQDEESPWNKFFQDNELRLTIKQDVIRTFPEVEFFRGSSLIEMMIDILFCFSREHATHSYKQGMHELLAPLIFVLHCDHQAFSHACEIESVLDIMKEVMDPAFLEHDAYSMFCQVMETVEPWYLSRDLCPKSGSMRSLEIINATPFARSNDLNPSSAIVTKLTRIQDYVLKKMDPELHQHLERLEIAPQIYGIRWLRLLFGREFPMQDILMLWDAIFGDGIGFDLVDYIFVAMLIYIRKDLITSDYTTCLTTLMKFPPVADVHYFVDMALYIREPSQYSRPPTYYHQGGVSIMSSNDSISGYDNVTSSSNYNNSSSKRKSNKGTASASHRGGLPGNKRQGPTLGGFSSFSRKFSRPRTLSVNSRATDKNMPKSSSEPMNLQTEMSPDEPAHPLGSTVSLSQVEESMLHHGPSASSLARMETSTARSAQSSPGIHHTSHIFPLTPEDAPESPTKFGTNKWSKKKPKKLTSGEKEWQDQVIHLQGHLNDKETMCRYCASKLDVHIETLQQDLSRRKLDVGDELMVSLAGIKLVRDILKGTLRFSQTMGEDVEDLSINDSYYEKEGYSNVDNSKASSECMSPESDILMGAGAGSGGGMPGINSSHYGKSSDFYISSEDASPVVHQGYDNGLHTNAAATDVDKNKRLNSPFYHPDPLDIREDPLPHSSSRGQHENRVNNGRKGSYSGNNNNITSSSTAIQNNSAAASPSSSLSNQTQIQTATTTVAALSSSSSLSSSTDATNPTLLTSRIKNIFKSTTQKPPGPQQQRKLSSSSNSGGEKIIEDYTTDAYPKSTVQTVQPESYTHQPNNDPLRAYGGEFTVPPAPSSSSTSSSTNHPRPEYVRNRSRSNVECSTNMARHHQAFSLSEEYPTSYHHTPHHHHHHHNRRGSKGSVGSNGSNSDFVIVGAGGSEMGGGGGRDGWSSSGDETNRSSNSPRMNRHKSRSQPINPLYSMKYDEGMDC